MSKKNALESIEHSRIYEDLSKAQKPKGKQAPASPAEMEERKAALKTQGKKGCKAVRINMAFTPDNHDFIKTMSKLTGQNMTEFTNFVIERYRTEHPELYTEAVKLRDKL